MHHGRPVIRLLVLDARAERPRAVIHVPIERVGHHQPPRGVQPQRMHVADEHQQPGQAHLQPELLGLLDGVDRVRPGIGDAQHFRAGRLRLQQQRGEIGGARKRIGQIAQHLAARRRHEAGGIALQRMAERVIRGDEIPGIPARLHHCPAGRLRQHVRVVHPVQRIGVALRPREVGRRGPRTDIGLVLFRGDRGDRKCDARIRHFHDQVHAVLVEPLARDAGADIRLVLMVGEDHLGGKSFRAEFRHRLLRAVHRQRPRQILIRARHVRQAPDLDDGGLRARHARQCGGGGGRAKQGTAGDAHNGRPSCE